MSESMLDAALKYADLGYKVFPCLPGRKEPATPRGIYNATSDLKQVEKWWTENPDCNIGLVTEGLVVVDIDKRDNPWPGDADKSLSLADSPLGLTANDGRHIFFRQPGGASWRNTASKLAPNVDTRATGGYVVAPPSRLANGGQYRWAEGQELSCGPEALPLPPHWLTEALEAPARAKEGKGEWDGGGKIPEGKRNDTLASYGGMMRRFGMTQAAIEAALLALNRESCSPILDAEEVRKIAWSVSRYEPDPAWSHAARNGFTKDLRPGGPIQIRQAGDLMDEFPELRPPLINKLLRFGETMNIISSAKVGKSWLITDLALAVSTGSPWLDYFHCQQGRVLIIDNELHPETARFRLAKVMERRGITRDEINKYLHFWHLRGSIKDLNALGKAFSEIQRGYFSLVILDAFYRTLPSGSDENDNGDMTALLNAIDCYSDDLGCAFVLVHHSSKGSQANKSTTDVGSGAGALSRAVDSHLILRPHEEDGAAVMDLAARSWPPLPSVCLRWEFPTWRMDTTLDPSKLATGKPKKELKEESPGSPDWTVESLVEAFVGPDPVPKTVIILNASKEGLSKRKCEEMLSLAEHTGLIYRWRIQNSNRAVYFSTTRQEQSNTDE